MESTKITVYRWSNPALTQETIKERMNIARDEEIKVLRGQIHQTCKKIHKILGAMLGYTYLAKKVCQFLPLILIRWVPKDVMALAGNATANTIRANFQQLLDVATAIAEPILWFYAVTACVLMVTGRTKTQGWEKLKNVGYAYIIMSCLSTVFAFFRWIAKLIQQAISMQ